MVSISPALQCTALCYPGEYHRSLLVDPNRPNRFWRIPGAAESMVVPSTEEQERTMERMERMQST